MSQALGSEPRRPGFPLGAAWGEQGTVRPPCSLCACALLQAAAPWVLGFAGSILQAGCEAQRGWGLQGPHSL